MEKLSLTAQQDGTLLYNQELTAGQTIASGTTIATILPKSSQYQVVLYIPQAQVAQIQVGQKLEYEFSGVSLTDFGKVNGEILAISADSVADQSSGQKYYKAIASIEKTVLENANGEVCYLQVGMLTQANAITGSQSILSWLFDKLNFY